MLRVKKWSPPENNRGKYRRCRVLEPKNWATVEGPTRAVCILKRGHVGPHRNTWGARWARRKGEKRG